MPASTLFAPITDRFRRRAPTGRGQTPMPADSARQIASGPNADRILIGGGGIASGVGTRRQDVALPGRLAVAVSALTGRGAIVDVTARRGLRVADTWALLDEVRVEHYDAIVLTLGAGDAHHLTSPRRWGEALEQLLDTLDGRMGRGTGIVLTSADPLPRSSGRNTPLSRILDTHARRLDEVAERIAAQRTNVEFAVTAESGPPVRWNSAFDYDRLGRRLAPSLAAHLDTLWTAAPAQSARRLRASSDPELLRQAALVRTGLLRSGSTPELDELLRRIADRMGVRAAGVTLIDGESQRTKAVVGADSLDAPRSEALCNATIRSDSAYLRTDLKGLPVERRGWQFYAGFPLESPDGYRIGAVCLLDPVRRPEGTIDESELADFATRVQNELWAEIAGLPSPSGDGTLDAPSLTADPPVPALHTRDAG